MTTHQEAAAKRPEYCHIQAETPIQIQQPHGTITLTAYHLTSPSYGHNIPCYTVGSPDMFDAGLLKGESGYDMQQRINMAKRVCGTCNFVNRCLEYAVAHDEWMVRGGTTPAERELLRAEWGWALVQLDFVEIFDAVREINESDGVYGDE